MVKRTILSVFIVRILLTGLPIYVQFQVYMREKIQFLLILIFLTASYTHVWAQNEITVTGKVTSSDNDQPLPGVSLLIRGTLIGTVTEADGTFSIKVPADGVLVFSFIGMNKEDVPVNGRTFIDVLMIPDLNSLSEIVVVGYGGEVSRTSLTGSISKIKGETIRNVPVQSVDRALQARAAGVFVRSANGQPGGVVQLRVRGTGSISAGNEPLYIVDGVQVNNDASNNAFTSTNPLNIINPNDIESVEVLKDAAAAAIYGSQASNGVVLITTKKGKAGETRATVNIYQGVVQPMKYMDMLNTQEFIQVRSEALQYKTGKSFIDARKTALAEIRLSGDLTQAQIDSLPTYDWQREAFRQGSTQNYDFSVRGGSENTTFYWSGSYNTSDASVIAIDFKRATTMLKLSHQIKNLTLEPSLFLSSTTQKGPFGGPNSGNFFGAASFASPLIVPINPIYNADGSFYGESPGGLTGAFTQNVIQVSNQNSIYSRTNQMLLSMNSTYKIGTDFMVRWVGGLDYRMGKGHSFTDPRTAEGFPVNGRVSEENLQNVNFNTNAVVNYHKTLRKHSIAGLLGAEYRRDHYQENNATGEGLATPDLQTLSSTANPRSVSGFETEFRRIGTFMQLKYDYDGKYFFQALTRYDGSSRFGKNNQYGLFPSVSGAWVISSEKFMEKLPKISFLKLRASYGVTGNDQIGNFASRGLFSGSGTYNAQSGTQVSSLANPNLKWERGATSDLGLDVGLLNNRVSITTDLFRRVSNNLLLSQEVPNTSGYDVRVSNTGQVVNKGWEIEVKSTNIDKVIQWTTDFNFTYIDNKVTKLYDGIKASTKDSLIFLPSNSGIIVGQPLGAIYNIRYAGVNTANGRPMWYDANGNATYSPSYQKDAQFLGDGFAEVYGGLNNTLKYKGLELSVLFQYEFGRTIYDSQRQFMASNGDLLYNTLQEYYDKRWQKPGDVTNIPRAGIDIPSAEFYTDASFIRLKQLTLSYYLPKAIISAARMKNIKVYAQAFNLHTWTRWKGYDVEFVDAGSGNNGSIPLARTFLFGIQLDL